MVMSLALTADERRWLDGGRRVLSDEEAVELEIPTDIGVQKERLPSIAGRSGTSVPGSGRSSAAAHYPPFSLKLVSRPAGKPFVRGDRDALSEKTERC